MIQNEIFNDASAHKTSNFNLLESLRSENSLEDING